MSSTNGHFRDPDSRQVESGLSSLPVITTEDCGMSTLASNQTRATIAGMPSMSSRPNVTSLSLHSFNVAHEPLSTPADSPPFLDFSPFDITTALEMAQWTLRQTYPGFEPPAAFVAADMSLHDLPIVYVSDGFVEMTGYDRDEILGRNCRFLQSPPGSHARDHINAALIQELKSKVTLGLVCQHAIPNFKKSGDMFLNLITIIPIPGSSRRFNDLIFGFSMDITNTDTNSFEMGFAESSSLLKRCRLTADTQSQASSMDNTRLTPMTCSIMYNSPDSSYICQSPPSISTTSLSPNQDTTGESLVWRSSESCVGNALISALDQIVGLILVVTLRGRIQYVSPSACTTDLEYDPDEIVGQRLQDICHHADDGLITRRIASAHFPSAPHHEGEFLFRLRRKTGPHVWYSCSTKLFQHDHRKFVMFSGWIRSAPSLSRNLVVSTGGGFGDRDLWLRITSSGLVLVLLSPVPTVLGLSESDVVMTTFQDRVDKVEVDDFLRMLAECKNNIAVSGNFKLKTPMTYDLQARITFYPDSWLTSRTTPFSAILHCRPAKAVKGHHAAAASSLPKDISRVPILASTSLNEPSRTGRGVDHNDHNDHEPAIITSAATTIATATTLTTKPAQEIAERKPSIMKPTPVSVTTALDPPFSSNTDIDNEDPKNDDDNDDNDNDDDDDIMKHNNGLASTNTCRTALAELHYLQAENQSLQAELQQLESFARHKKRLKTLNHAFQGCANCRARVSPEWRRGPSGERDLCNRCGLRWAKLNGGHGGYATSAGGGAVVAARSILNRNRIGPFDKNQVQSASRLGDDRNGGGIGIEKGRAVQMRSGGAGMRTKSGKRLREKKDCGDAIKDGYPKLPRSLPDQG